MSGFQVGPEIFLTLTFQVFDAEGEAASELEVISTVFGMGQLLPGVEKALEGKMEGERLVVTLPASKAYGKRDPSRILEVDRSEFPDTVAVGDRFEMENTDGGVLVIHILDVQDDHVVMDTNHPLADQEISFHIELTEVRPATAEEMEAAEALMTDDTDYLQADLPNITPSSLIRGAARG